MSKAPLKVLIIGCGNIAGGYDLRSTSRAVWSHAKAYRLTKGVNVVGAIDSSPRRAQEFAKTWNIPFAGTSLTIALKKLNPDLVSICSPTHTHLPLIQKLSDHKTIRGILCEKPLAYDLDQAQEAIRLCKKSGILLAVDYQRNWDAQLNSIGANLRDGKRGKIHLIRALYSKGLVHNGSHFISLLIHWFGDLHIQSITSVQQIDQSDLCADFTAQSQHVPRIIFQNIPQDSFVLNEVECFCENGRLELREGAQDIRWSETKPNPLLPNDRILDRKAAKLRNTLPQATLKVIRNVVATLHGKESLRSTPDNALQTLKICQKIRNLSLKFKTHV